MQTNAYCRISPWFQGSVSENQDNMLYEDVLLYDFMPLDLTVF
jgi:hypothetical protein